MFFLYRYLRRMQKLITIWEKRKNDNKYSDRIDKKIQKFGKKQLAEAQATHEKVFQEMDCLMCANCCKSIPPMLSSRDIKRISRRLSMSPKEFSLKYTIVDEDGDTVISSSPCPFLQSDNKCSIYEDRPSACRLYPHSGEQMFLQNLSHHKRNMKYCPGLMEIMRRLADY